MLSTSSLIEFSEYYFLTSNFKKAFPTIDALGYITYLLPIFSFKCVVGVKLASFLASRSFFIFSYFAFSIIYYACANENYLIFKIDFRRYGLPFIKIFIMTRNIIKLNTN